MSSTVKKVKAYCLELLTNSKCSVLPFHSVQHTLEVFKNVEIIGALEELSTVELEIVQIAALFHDTGVSTSYVGHEDLSAINAILFLDSIKYPEDQIAAVIACINATKMPQSPKNCLERVICDADLFHLGSNSFKIKNELLRAEWKIYLNLTFTDEEWKDLNIDFLRNHHFHSTYGKATLEVKKQINILSLETQRIIQY